jgi:UDP-N-acetylglucosamine 2-epimerase (non-hydrolysing)
MKVAPIIQAASRRPGMQTSLVHTGQHYDERMSALFFRDLGLPAPDVDLGVGSGSHAVQTARVMMAFDQVLDSRPTDVVLVVGDVNSTIACALVAVKRGVRIAHVEAGLRSRDRTMPEEINRILTDQISDLLFTTERSAAKNLTDEGVDPRRIHFVGNVMIDTLTRHLSAARATNTPARFGLVAREYAVSTLHRPSNVDTREAAALTTAAILEVARRMPVLLPLHPRTRSKWESFGLLANLEREGVRVAEPLGYLEFLGLLDGARLVFTDSGGIQEETTALGVPCLTFRENTERPVTVTEGTNEIVGTDPHRVAVAVDRVIGGGTGAAKIPEFWDGHAAERVVDTLAAQP